MRKRYTIYSYIVYAMALHGVGGGLSPEDGIKCIDYVLNGLHLYTNELLYVAIYI